MARVIGNTYPGNFGVGTDEACRMVSSVSSKPTKTAIFIKTSESSQEEYCIEDDKIVDIANENIGKKLL